MRSAAFSLRLEQPEQLEDRLMSSGERQASLFGRADDEPEEEPLKAGRGKDRRQDAFGQSGASALLHYRADQPPATRMRPDSLPRGKAGMRRLEQKDGQM
jgi:hypothetical protein